MREIRLRGKSFFPGLMAVLVSPKPIKVLCAFGSRDAMRAQFHESADQVLKLGQGFKVMTSNWTIVTPIGSVLMFRDISTRESMTALAGYELHDVWVDPAHPISVDDWQRLQCRARL